MSENACFVEKTGGMKYHDYDLKDRMEREYDELSGACGNI